MSGFLNQNSSGGSGFTGVTVDGVTVFGNGLTTPLSAQFNQNGKYLISGGAAWTGTGYVYDVSALSYFIDGNYNTAQTSVTLAASDPTNPRVDVIIADDTETVSVLTGTPAPVPVPQAIPDNAIAIDYITVAANSTTPTVTTEIIYSDGTSSTWTYTTYTTSGTPVGTTNFMSTNAPYQGTHCIANSRDGRTGIRFIRGTSEDITQYALMSFYVRFAATIPNTKALDIRLENTAGNPFGNTINLFSYGLSRTITNTWQLIVIPVSVFGAITLYKGIRTILAGGTNGVLYEWDIDYMLFNSGTIPQSNVPTLTFQQNGTAIGNRSIGNFTTTTSVTPSLTDDPVNNRVNISFTTPLAAGTGTQSGSNFIGSGAGSGATYADESFFAGTDAGFGAINADHSTFIGDYAGYGASGADHSTFIGSNAGYDAYNASNSVYLGFEAGQNNYNAQSMIGIGYRAGYGDTSNNGSSILLGANTNAGAYDNVVVLGTGSSVSADHSGQVKLDPLLTTTSIRGIDYIWPTVAPTTGQSLKFNGTSLYWG